MTRWLYSPHIGTVQHAFERQVRAGVTGADGWASVCGLVERGEGAITDDDERCLACVQILGERKNPG